MGDHELQRQLNSRQVTFMALGTAIGVGLFLGSGQAISLAGPSILLAYLVSGIAIFFIMRALGEMAVNQPISGSFSAYASQYLGPLAGYLTGWNYWIMMLGAGIAETTAVGIYMKFWFPEIPQWAWVCASVISIGALNMLSVKIYGELEFWFTLIKVLAILLLIAGGLSIILLGWGNAGQAIYFSNLWEHGGWFPNGMLGMLMAIPIAFCGLAGIEMVGIAAGEAAQPERTIPRAINSVVWRILVFYIGSLLVILALYPWQQIGTQGSPFVITFEKLGIRQAAGIINFVVITAALSAFNSILFCNGRMLQSLALQKHAPAILSKVNKQGVPARAILISLVCLAIGIVLNYLFPEHLFAWLIALLSFNAIWTWYMILLAHYRFRQTQTAVTKNNFPMPMWPIGSWVVMLFMGFILGMMAYIPETRPSIFVGLGWLVFMTILYKILIHNRTEN